MAMNTTPVATDAFQTRSENLRYYLPVGTLVVVTNLFVGLSRSFRSGFPEFLLSDGVINLFLALVIGTNLVAITIRTAREKGEDD